MSIIYDDEIKSPFKYNIVGVILGLILGILASLAVMGTGIGFIFNYRIQEQSKSKTISVETITTNMANMKASLTDALSVTEILTELMIAYNYNISLPLFLNITSRLRKRHPIISAYEYGHGEGLPLILIDPVTSPAYGLKILDANPFEAAQALKAIENNTVTIYGPFNLIQGGVALVGTYPIFYPDGSLYGISSILISLDQLFSLINLPTDFRYLMYNVGGVFYNNTLPGDTDNTQLQLEIYDEVWTILIYSNNGWYLDNYVWLETISITFLMILVILVCIFIVRSISMGLYSKNQALYYRNEFELELNTRMGEFKSGLLHEQRNNIIVVSTQNGNIATVEGNIYQYLLYQPSELIGKPISTILISRRFILDKNGHKRRCIYTVDGDKYTVSLDTINDELSQSQ